MTDNLTPSQRSYCMSQIKGKDTKPEKKVRSALHVMGYRFRKNVQNLPGKPDIVFTRAKLVIFIDGEFWHGYQFEQWRETIPDFWKEKITKNIDRDRMNSKILEEKGWTVLRIWQKEVEKNFGNTIRKIQMLLPKRIN